MTGETVSFGSQAVADEAAMQALGRSIANDLKGNVQTRRKESQNSSPPAFLITLSGELGAGKSVLARSVIHALGYQGRVKSPTYTLIESYTANDIDQKPVRIAHLDLYRLADPEELSYLGFDDVLHEHDLVLIEWPEQGGDLLPQADLHLRINYQPDGGRSVRFTSAVA